MIINKSNYILLKLFNRLKVRKFLHKIFLTIGFGVFIISAAVLTIVILDEYFTISSGGKLAYISVAGVLAVSGTTIAIKRLLMPLQEVTDSLDKYLSERKVPELPTHYKGELGIMMKEIQYSINTLDDFMVERDELLTLMGYDLKNLLSSIINNAEILDKVEDPEKMTKIKSSILSSANAQENLINKIYDILRQERAAIKYEDKQYIDLKEILDQILINYSTDLHDKDNFLEMNLEAKQIFADRDQIPRVFINIISNAVKYTENGTIKISSMKHGDTVQVTIQDTGVGFPPDKSEKIFEQFTKLRRVGTRGEHSLGLGLFLTKKIVKRHSGKIEAYSDGPDKGAKFVITLPNE